MNEIKFPSPKLLSSWACSLFYSPFLLFPAVNRMTGYLSSVLLISFVVYRFSIFYFYGDVWNDENQRTVVVAGCVLEELKEDKNSSGA